MSKVYNYYRASGRRMERRLTHRVESDKRNSAVFVPTVVRYDSFMNKK